MSVAGKRIAVTGATGFVGRYLVERLVGEGAQVLALSRRDVALGEGVECQTTDYSRSSLSTALRGVDAILHLAGRRMTHEDDQLDPGPFFDPNVRATGALFDAGQEVGITRFVFASTIAVYGPSCPMPYQEDYATQPLNAYALSKRMAEVLLQQKSRGTDIGVACLRLAAIYGHGEKGTPALMRFVDQAARGEVLKLTGNRNYTIDQLYVRDAAHAFVKALAVEGFEVLNIGGGPAASVEKIACAVNDVFHPAGQVDTSGAASSPAAATWMKIDRAQQKIDWRPDFSLTAGLMDFKASQER